MKIGSLSPATLSARLRGPGLPVTIGPFRVLFGLKVRRAEETFHRLYADFPVADGEAMIDSVVTCIAAADPGFPLRRAAICRIDGRRHSATRFLGNATPSLEWAVNWSIATRAHWFLIVHAAVVATPEGAVILPGGSGSGKSTLAAALAAGGWRLLSDEFAIIDADAEVPVLHPCPRAVSLKNRSIGLMRDRAPDRMLAREFPRTGKGTVGYFLPSAEDVARQKETIAPRLIVFPRWRAGSPPTLTPLGKTESFVALIRNSVNYDLLGETGARATTEMVRRCPAYLFEYDDLDAACALIASTANREAAGHVAA
ncbi:MAG: HprK-related kinase A [Gammaproteobacteria bacterium]|nr:HprK-related kinase A [Gammaproteobacteria bacterium]